MQRPSYPNLRLEPPPIGAEIDGMTPNELVNKLWDKRIRNRVQRTLVGGLSARETRGLELSPEVREAVIRGLDHWSPVVRRWCLTIIDHHGDEACIVAAARMLNDPVPRVRQFALHALECERCNPEPEVIAARRRLLAEHVPHSADTT